MDQTNESNKHFWRATKSLRNQNSGLPHIIDGDNYYTNAHEKANHFARKFAEAHNSHHTLPNEFDEETEATHNATRTNHITEEDFIEFSTNDLIEALVKCKNGKSPGHDGITYRLLKQLPIEAMDLLTSLYNRCIIIGYWPKYFSRAIVVPIKKAGKPANLLTSYRPISLLPTLGKTLEKMIGKRLSAHLHHNNILPKHQFGFRHNHSAPDQALRLAATIKNAKRNKMSCGILSFDVQKAFDSVWHASITYKMKRYGFCPFLTRIIAIFTHQRTFRVRVDAQLSADHNIPAGTPQGSALSPILYIIVSADLPEFKNAITFTYADDTCIVVQAKQHRKITNWLSKAATSLNAFMKRWHLQLNVAKTDYLFCPPDRKRIRTPTVPLNCCGARLRPSDAIKYLGVYFDTHTKFTKHIELVKGKMIATVKSLYPMIKNTKLNLKNRLLIVKQILLARMAYAMPAWADNSKTAAIALRRSFSRAAKTCLGLEWRHPTDDLDLQEAQPPKN